MINKPNPIRWLENETGQRIHYPTGQTPGQDRHLSVRLPAALAASLDSLADRLATDVAEVRRRLAG